MRRNWNGGIFFKSLTCMKESVMLRRFIIAIATVAALGISFSSTDASAQKSGVRGKRGPGLASRGYANRGGYGGRYYGGGYGGGWGYYGGAFAAGAIVGGLLAAPYYDGSGYAGD